MTVDSGGSVQLEMPVLGPLLQGPIRAGKLLLFLFDPDSVWPTMILNIVAGLLQKQIDVLYVVTSRRVSDVREDLLKRGINAETYEQNERLVLSDAYTFKTGRSSPEKISHTSLNVSELSIVSAKALDQWPSGSVRIFENVSEIVEASEEKSFLKFYRTWTSRLVTSGRIVIDGFVRGVHSESLYNSVMSIADGVFELRTEDMDGQLSSVLRARSFKGGVVDTSRRVVRVSEDLGVHLEPLAKRK